MKVIVQEFGNTIALVVVVTETEKIIKDPFTAVVVTIIIVVMGLRFYYFTL